ncbi:MAG: iron export ABC transporter permease subunit FetB [Desulfovibrionaceae bacterium]|jgi:putative ABC transport system permease protein|nr:iron export ABC transporter permease subunit FetB [Desulfovibrionaceae bacterium]
MNTAPLLIGNWQLAIAALFVLVAGGTSLANRLGLERDLAIGTVRTVAQLTVMGYALRIIFGLNNALLVLGVFCVMIFTASRIVKSRVAEKQIPFYNPVLGSMLVSFTSVTIIVTAAVVQVHPWWKAEYFLPIGGMVVGNSMTAIALGLDRLFSDLRARRAEVEMRLCLGATAREATREIMAAALKAGMIPSINSMMSVGIVFLPGMMTGQILSGTDPVEAVRYQIVVMLMLSAAAALGTLLVLHLVLTRCFGPGQQLALTADGD